MHTDLYEAEIRQDREPFFRCRDHRKPGTGNYSASKAGIIGLTKSVAKELASRGVTCNAVAPGFVATDMVKELTDDTAAIESQIPLGRLGKPEEIADAVAFLLDADYITGVVLKVDGGIAM